jgi:site-specific recombinase XerD
LTANAELLEGLSERGRIDGQPFLIGPDGRADAGVNAFFASPRMRSKSPLTWSKYAQSLAMWLNYLEAQGRSWDRASVDDAEYFKEWRLTEARNPGRVEASTFVANLAALRTFYRWASPRYGIVDPVAASDDVDLAPRGARRQNVKWLDPGGYRRWRDLGVRGLGTDGRPDRRYRGRNEQRDSAFVDGLYSTGLRLTEWASVVLPELPDDDPHRGYSTCQLADACAKGGYGHPYWLPRQALLSVLDYVEGARARSVRDAQLSGRYDAIRQRRLMVGAADRYVVLEQADGTRVNVRLNVLAPAARRVLFRKTRHGIEPLALWLNEDGLPRLPHGWQHTFSQANQRVARRGLKDFSVTPHMLRHSCALRWYAVGRLAYERRFAHLSEDETKDFRQQFGDTWDLVATYLGHRNPETTKTHYLEPFRALDVEILLQHAHDAAVESFLASYLAAHPLVRTDPFRGVS